LAVSFRPRFIISLKRSTFLPFRSAKTGHEADYPIWFAHGRAASRWLFLTAADPDRKVVAARKRVFSFAVMWRRAGGEWGGSNFDATASAEVDAVGEGEFEAEPAA
jgi:transposase